MYPPVDYPVKENTDSESTSNDLTYASLLDRHEGQQTITTSMIQTARVQLEAAHQLPDAATRTFIGEQQSKPVIKRLFKAMR